MTRPDDDLRDAHLLAALRHAPDREAAPPPAVSALILARARAAAAPRSRWLWLLDTLRRPHVAGAFATLAVATLVGVMWSAHEVPPPEVSRPMPEPLGKAEKAKDAKEAKEADTADKTPPAKADAPAAQAVSGAATLPAPFVDTAPPVVASVPAAPQKSRDDGAKRSAPQAPAPATSRARTQPSVSEPKEAEVLRPAPSPLELGGAAPAAAPAPPVVAALPAPAAPPPAPEDAARERRTLSDAAKASASGRAASSMPRPSPGANLAARQEGAAETAALTKQLRAVDDPLPRMEVLLAGARGDTVWTPARGKASPHGQAQRELWSRVREATRGRWVRAEGVPAAPEPWLVLTQGGQRVAALWIEPGALILSDGTRLWRAALDEALLREWQEAVARW